MGEVRIDNKRYNIDKAKLIAVWDNGLCAWDFDFIREMLYRKKTGEFFLYGVGGARTKYQAIDGDGKSSIGGEEIVPLTDAEAKEWLETYTDEDTYKTIFPE